MATHYWPGTKQEFVEFSDCGGVEDMLVAANRSQFDEEMDYTFVTRVAPLRQRIPVGGGWVRKVWLAVRDTLRYLAGSRA
jgi:hypothetical protein